MKNKEQNNPEFYMRIKEHPMLVVDETTLNQLKEDSYRTEHFKLLNSIDEKFLERFIGKEVKKIAPYTLKKSGYIVKSIRVKDDKKQLVLDQFEIDGLRPNFGDIRYDIRYYVSCPFSFIKSSITTLILEFENGEVIEVNQLVGDEVFRIIFPDT